MDVEKLIRRLRNDADAYRNGETLGRAFADQEDVLDNAATALSTLKAENEKLRAELEQMDACIYYKAGGLCRYGGDDPGNVCVFGPCPQEVSSQDILAELEQVKLAARNDIPHNCHTCMDKSNPTCPGNKRTNSFGYQENCEKWTWRGPQKED